MSKRNWKLFIADVLESSVFEDFKQSLKHII
jgi:hypothetical protein